MELSFNSILVRLKGSPKKPEQPPFKSFNSILVRLKAQAIRLTYQ